MKPRNWILPIVVLLAAAGGTWAFMEFVVWNKLPSDLVGKWVVQGGEQDGATFDFYRGGTMIGRINMNGKEGIINARVAVEEETLVITTHDRRSQREVVKRQVIQELTAHSLVLQDEKKNVLRMSRATN